MNQLSPRLHSIDGDPAGAPTRVRVAIVSACWHRDIVAQATAAAHDEHREFFTRHFVQKGTEVAHACLATLASPQRLSSGRAPAGARA